MQRTASEYEETNIIEPIMFSECEICGGFYSGIYLHWYDVPLEDN